MKKIIILAMCMVSTLSHSKDLSTKKELLADIKEETKKCAVQVVGNTPENDNGTVIGFKSVCSSLVITSTSEAHILIDGEWIVAKIKESKESDGGDLDDLFILNAKNQVIATKTNVPSYDNVIVAMAGDSDFDGKVEAGK